VRESQIARLDKIRATRDAAAVQKALDALTKCAETGEGNLLDLSVKAVRLRATVGEISDALEKVFGRYRANRKPFPASMEPSWKNRKTGRPSRPTSRPSSPKKAAARA
jgi:hypothetical protein